jgi:dihydroneopterin triphosphate diphosphatase
VPSLRITHVEVHLFRRRGARVEFLALRRARDRDVLPGIWQPVTGRLDRGERPEAAARREVREETGIEPVRWWWLETLSTWYDADARAVQALPLLVAEIAPDARVTLSDEHDAWAFVTAAEAARRYLWDSQRAALAAVRSQVLRGGPLARALALPEPRRARARGRRAAAAPTRRRPAPPKGGR